MKKRISLLAGVFGVLGTMAVVLPRFFARAQGGFDAGAAAALAFFVFGGLAALVALFLLGDVLLHFRRLGPADRVVGTLPFLLIALLVFFFWAYAWQ